MDRAGSGRNIKMQVSSYGRDNTKTGRTDGDDTGLPESPIYSNFPRRLWRTHVRHGLVRSPDRSRENRNGHRPPRDGLSPD